MTAPALDAGLPVIAAGLPLRSDGRANLPAPAASLPAAVDPRAHLPANQASLPIRSEGNLPSPAATLPIPLDSLPAPASARAFGEIELPTFGDVVPPSAPPSSAASRSIGFVRPLRRDRPAARVASELAAAAERAHRERAARRPGGLQRPRARRSALGAAAAPAQSLTPPILRSDAPRLAGGMSFGEVDIGGSGGAAEASIGLDASDHLGRDSAREAPLGIAAASAPVRGRADAARRRAPQAFAAARRSASGWRCSSSPAGAALQVTPYGAFGYVAIDDAIHASDYRQATLAAITDTDKADGGRHLRRREERRSTRSMRRRRGRRGRARSRPTPRSPTGRRPSASAPIRRGPRARSSCSGACPPTRRCSTATPRSPRRPRRATRSTRPAGPSTPRARARPPADAIQHDLALLAGELALVGARRRGRRGFVQARARGVEPTRGRTSGWRAPTISLGDAAGEKLEIAATLAASPGHPGALDAPGAPEDGGRRSRAGARRSRGGPRRPVSREGVSQGALARLRREGLGEPRARRRDRRARRVRAGGGARSAQRRRSQRTGPALSQRGPGHRGARAVRHGARHRSELGRDDRERRGGEDRARAARGREAAARRRARDASRRASRR